MTNVVDEPMTGSEPFVAIGKSSPFNGRSAAPKRLERRVSKTTSGALFIYSLEREPIIFQELDPLPGATVQCHALTPRCLS
jgi:hypothetical protein